jgi:hypothetical protein
MSNDLVRRGAGGLSAREQRQLSRELAAEQLPAKRAAARIQAAAWATHCGLTCCEVLTALEVQAVQRQGAVLDARARAIGDSYAALVTTELTRLSLTGQ